MSKARFYPGADRTSQNFGNGNVTMGGVTKLVLHTTETRSWPAYGGSAGNPTLTFNPWLPRGKRWRQHVPLNGSATTLKDPSGTAVRENRDDVAQVEIVAYCDPNLYNKYGYAVTNISDDALLDLAEFIAWVHNEWGMPINWAPNWAPYPKSCTVDRFSGPRYDSFQGILGHCHVSGNDHGDPGALDIPKLKSLVNQVLGKDKPDVTNTKPDRPKGAPLSSATVGDILNYDGLDAPSVDEKAPRPNWYWTPASYVRASYLKLVSIESLLKEILDTLKAK